MKNIIVTGCAGGIGAATAKIFLEAGYSVTGLIRSTPAAFEKDYGDRFICVRGDVG